ncbi:MAG: sulfatase, partial [Planctomycetota bacterium]
MLNRRQLLAGTGAGAFLAAGCGRDSKPSPGSSAAPEGRPLAGPNVLFVMPDEWRGQAFGYRGNPDVNTPVIDAFARDGVRFERSFVNVPQCSPNRATLLTGRFPQAAGVLTNDLPVRADVGGLARTLSDAGWNCGYIGKWHLDGWPRDRYTPPGPRRLGFDGLWAAANGAHDYFDGRYFTRDGEQRVAEGYEPEFQTELAIAELERAAAAEEPFFLFLSWGPPHAPFFDLPAEYAYRASRMSPSLRPNADPRAFSTVDLALYYAACEALDDLFARLTGALERLGLADDTLVVFTSDHGSMLGSHGLTGKQTPFEEAISVPLLFRQPGRLPAGLAPEALFSALDMAPTLCGLLGVEPDPGFQGRDLSGVVGGQASDGPDSVYLGDLLGLGRSFVQRIYTWRGLRTREWTYAEDARGPWLLYDLQTDPYQQRNLVGRSEHGEVQGELAARLGGWAERLGDPRLTARA